MIINGDLVPKCAKSLMEQTINRTYFDADSTYYLAVKALNINGEPSPISEIKSDLIKECPGDRTYSSLHLLSVPPPLYDEVELFI